MNTATLEIGGLAFKLSGGESVATAMALPGWNVFRADHNAGLLAPDLEMILDTTIAPPDNCRVLHSFAVEEDTAECRFMVDTEGDYYYTFSCGGTLRVAGHAECTAMPSPSLLRFAIWLAYGMMAVGHGRLPIHSSAVVHRGRAVLCLGESGTGKSTHTRLWLNNIPDCHLLNDDSPILAVTPEGTMVYGSPWSGKTHCYRQERHPVAALVRLEQRPNNSICLLPTLQAFGSVQPSLPPAMAHDEHMLDAQVAFVSRIIAATPVYRLGCRPDAEAAQMSYNAVFKGVTE